MARKKRVKQPLNVAPELVHDHDPALSAATSADSSLSTNTMRLCSLLIAAHFSILLLSLAANLSPSFLQGQLTGGLAPYLVTTAQDYGAVPLELTHANSYDFPLLVETHRQNDPAGEWTTIDLPGWRARRDQAIEYPQSRWCNAARILRLIADDIADSEILAEFAVAILHAQSPREQEAIDHIRFVAPHIPTFDEFGVLAAGQAELAEGLFDDEVIYSAQVLQGVDGRIGLVPLQSSARTSKPTSTVGGPP